MSLNLSLGTSSLDKDLIFLLWLEVYGLIHNILNAQR
jgi:hypothetical protein